MTGSGLLPQAPNKRRPAGSVAAIPVVLLSLSAIAMAEERPAAPSVLSTESCPAPDPAVIRDLTLRALRSAGLALTLPGQRVKLPRVSLRAGGEPGRSFDAFVLLSFDLPRSVFDARAAHLQLDATAAQERQELADRVAKLATAHARLACAPRGDGVPLARAAQRALRRQELAAELRLLAGEVTP